MLRLKKLELKHRFKVYEVKFMWKYDFLSNLIIFLNIYLSLLEGTELPGGATVFDNTWYQYISKYAITIINICMGLYLIFKTLKAMVLIKLNERYDRNSTNKALFENILKGAEFIEDNVASGLNTV